MGAGTWGARARAEEESPLGGEESRAEGRRDPRRDDGAGRKGPHFARDL